MEYFVEEKSIVRTIWGKADTILIIFAGAAAEFALNKAVDWLYFTGKLPSDPLGRLFSTVEYARQIVFLEKEAAHKAIDKISAIHNEIEKSRGQKIPEWAYRDVLYMLIHYSIAGFELMERKLTPEEKQEVYNVFFKLGKRMQLIQLPTNYNEWQPDRKIHLENDLAKTSYTSNLYEQYKKHLGSFRYRLVLAAQSAIVPDQARKLLDLKKSTWFGVVLALYKMSRILQFNGFLKKIILPTKFQDQIKALDKVKT